MPGVGIKTILMDMQNKKGEILSNQDVGMDEGKVKFNCNWIYSPPIVATELKQLNFWRNQLHRIGLIGVYLNGISFGNISIRDKNSHQFLITGTSTGRLKHLNAKHYTRVVDFDLTQNGLTCLGPIKASSESLTHAAIYQSDSEIKAVVHVHHLNLWQTLINQLPTTAPEVAYGTPEMAYEIFRLFKQEDEKSKF